MLLLQLRYGHTKDSFVTVKAKKNHGASLCLTQVKLHLDKLFSDIPWSTAKKIWIEAYSTKAQERVACTVCASPYDPNNPKTFAVRGVNPRGRKFIWDQNELDAMLAPFIGKTLYLQVSYEE